ncbi:hypothetical protein [uncultured Stenotrophomonas sp.]|uniref:hypothetical protein n=1 Tax=uncultured Stenotrophomonas sp. TaxID=165438 RepID=UPI0025F82C44|nr:hypothetical protein [uncultured Stenotrophomonas sp.]
MKALITLVAALAAGPALADAPLPPPERFTACSPARNLCADSDPALNSTRVTPHASGQEVWLIPGWHRWLFPSDDGESVVVGYEGMNLVPVDVTLSEPVLLFYHRGRLVRTVTLGQLYRRTSQLRRTVSHFAWVSTIGFNHSNQLVVELVNGDKVAFAAGTGVREPVRPDGR